MASTVSLVSVELRMATVPPILNSHLVLLVYMACYLAVAAEQVGSNGDYCSKTLRIVPLVRVDSVGLPPTELLLQRS